MKTFIRQFVSIICVVAMLLTLNVSVFASGEGLAFDMNALGITTGMDADARVDDYVRRDEFAQMVVGMIMQQEVAKSLENEVYFNDVSDSQYKGAVNLLAKLGYISGNGDGNFNPSAYISYGAACKILVCALGYEPIVEDKSLNGYMFVAGSIGITKNIDSSDENLTFAKAMKMVDNALDIGLMVPMYYNGNIAPSYEVDNSRTFRSYHNGRYGEGVVKLHGIVTADKSSYLYNPVPNLKDTQIVIEDKIYNYDGIAPTGYVGQTVEYYVSVNEYNEELIVAFAPTNKNTVNDFMGSQITKLAKEEVAFEDADGYKNTVKTNYETRFIYNNRIDLKYKLTDIKQNNNFVVRTVDNDEDDIAEVVFVYEYKDCIVEKVYEETGVIT
ncbi:MAG: S-layer homology domain-containing protein, partial [Clostridia bacterium]|nr:S-layer homology domain-containing protein [Clostridia bacterium]